MQNKIKLVLWDLGGVLIESPIEKFKKYEKSLSIPTNSIIKINSYNHLNNAWAKLEKNLISKNDFLFLFKKEAEFFNLYNVDPIKVLYCLDLKIIPEMLLLLKEVKKKYLCACLTNNIDDKYLNTNSKKVNNLIKKNFSFVFESSKLHMRKPETEIYQLVIRELSLKPNEILFLDDFGINLKPARKIGIETFKVSSIPETINFLRKRLNL